MEKKHFQSKQQRLQTNRKPVPHIRYNKQTEEWIMNVKYVDTPEEIKLQMNKKQLNSIAKIVAYMYHDKKKHYEETASDTRKTHIYNDIKAIDQWLESQYKRLGVEDETKRKSK